MVATGHNEVGPVILLRGAGKIKAAHMMVATGHNEVGPVI